MSKQKPIIITDLDDVICKGGYLYLLNKYLNTSYSEENFKGLKYFEDIIEDPLQKQIFIHYLCKQNPYYHTHLIDGAYDSLKLLSKEFEIYICSAFYWPEVEYQYSSMLIDHKLRFIANNLDFVDLNNVILSNNKNMFSGIFAQIDDRIDNLNSDAEHKILFDSYASSHISKSDAYKKGKFKVYNWNQALDRLLG